jgi:hypothetical protein
MSRFLHSGHHEVLLPAHLGQVPVSLRLWVDMTDIVPLLERLDVLYGAPGRPYCRDLEQVPAAQQALLELIREFLCVHPDRVRRPCTTAAVAEHLLSLYHVGRIDAYPAYPPSIDQVDLDPAALAPHLPALLRGAPRPGSSPVEPA